jgi:hypothetical protein
MYKHPGASSWKCSLLSVVLSSASPSAGCRYHMSQGTAAGCTAAAAGYAAVYAGKCIISRYRSIGVLIYKSGLNTYIVRI